MVENVKVLVVDDLDGSSDAKTRTFGWQGRLYEIDLSDENADALSKVFAPYVAAGHVVASTPVKLPKTRGLAAAKARREAIRAWARDRGLVVARRGEPAPWLVEMYEAEQAKETKASAK